MNSKKFMSGTYSLYLLKVHPGVKDSRLANLEEGKQQEGSACLQNYEKERQPAKKLVVFIASCTDLYEKDQTQDVKTG